MNPLDVEQILLSGKQADRLEEAASAITEALRGKGYTTSTGLLALGSAMWGLLSTSKESLSANEKYLWMQVVCQHILAVMKPRETGIRWPAND